ncbi:MAG: SRPBCC family protein [Saprospiraceae bacterium]|nr:SRPBCC family protein [Saprospiraceae bacterium]
MKYTNTIEINLPRQRVIDLFDNPENMKAWQPGLVSFTHNSGVPGEEGAKSTLIYKTGKREVEMIETVIKRDLPYEFSGSYEMKGIYNSIQNYFIEKSPEVTVWKSQSEFTFKGIMRFLAPLMKNSFKKQSLDFMQRFKSFAESNG